MPNFRAGTLLLPFLAALSCAWPVVAGHSIFTQLVFQEQIPTGLERPHAYVSVGIPLPLTSESKDTQNLVLVGAEATQFRALNHWPSGDIRWLKIDAIIPVKPDAPTVGLQLTTGQGSPAQDAVATETETHWLLRSGAPIFHIPKGGHTVFEFIQGSGDTAPIPYGVVVESMQLPYDTDSEVQLEENGPVRASLVRRRSVQVSDQRGEIILRWSAAQQQNQLEFTVAILAAPENTGPLELEKIRIPFTSGGWQPTDTEDARFWEGQIGGIPALFYLKHSAGSATQACLDIPSNELGASRISKISVPPGALFQTQLVVALNPTESSPELLASPMVARAASPDVYNDTWTFHDQLIATPAVTPPDGQTPITRAHRSLRQYLESEGPSFVEHFGPFNANFTKAWQQGFQPTDLPGELPQIWPLMSGDSIAASAYNAWATAHANTIRPNPSAHQRPLTLLALVDQLKNQESPETRSVIVALLDGWLLTSSGANEAAVRAAAQQGTETLAAVSQLIANSGWNATRLDRLEDLRDALLMATPAEARSDRWYFEAYLSSGDPKLLKAGQAHIDEHPSEAHSNLRHLIRAPLRYRIWRPLQIKVNHTGPGQATATWIAPERAERYRIKASASSFSAPNFLAPPAELPFDRAPNLDSEPIPGKPGTPQSLPLRFAKGTDSVNVVGMYLERGQALPAPQATDEKTAGTTVAQAEPESRFSTSIQLLMFAGIIIIIALMLMVLNRSKQSSHQTLWLVLAIGWLASGCLQEPKVIYHETEDEVVTTEPQGQEIATDQGNYRVRFASSPSPIPLNDHFQLEVTVAGAPEALEAIALEVDADMPAHGHGINTEPTVKPLGNGKYQVDGILFHMKGDWELYLDVVDGPVRERATFPLTL